MTYATGDIPVGAYDRTVSLTSTSATALSTAAATLTWIRWLGTRPRALWDSRIISGTPIRRFRAGIDFHFDRSTAHRAAKRPPEGGLL